VSRVRASAGLPRPVRPLVVRRVRQQPRASEVHGHGTDGRRTPTVVVQPRRLPALLHVGRPATGPLRRRQRPLSVRQPVRRHAARVHLLGAYPARFQHSLTDPAVSPPRRRKLITTAFHDAKHTRPDETGITFAVSCRYFNTQTVSYMDLMSFHMYGRD